MHGRCTGDARCLQAKQINEQSQVRLSMSVSQSRKTAESAVDAAQEPRTSVAQRTSSRV